MVPSPQYGPQVQSAWQALAGHAVEPLPSHYSLPFTTLSPQYGPQVQLAWQALGGHWPLVALPSHCSPNSTVLLPHVEPQVHDGLHWPGQLASSLPSHCSLA